MFDGAIGGFDRFIFEDIDLSTVSFSRAADDQDDLLVTLQDGAVIRFDEQFDSLAWYRIESSSFRDPPRLPTRTSWHCCNARCCVMAEQDIRGRVSVQDVGVHLADQPSVERGADPAQSDCVRSPDRQGRFRRQHSGAIRSRDAGIGGGAGSLMDGGWLRRRARRGTGRLRSTRLPRVRRPFPAPDIEDGGSARA